MADLRRALEKLGEPDLEAVDRVWTRFRKTRAHAPVRRRRVMATASVTLLAASALGVIWALSPEQPRSLSVEATVTPVAHAWGDHVALSAVGQGLLVGTGSDAVLHWSSGSVQLEVTPNTQTRLSVVTDEAVVEVVGTVFGVRRGALGSTVTVERGKVRVSCADGTGLELLAGAEHTCLPVTAAGLLGRADALIDAGLDDQLPETLDRGVALGDGPVKGELLVRRMRQHARSGDVDQALDDARSYATHGSGREQEVQRFAAWLALEHKGCAAAMPWLDGLHQAGSSQDSVLLAECLAPTDPVRAQAILHQAMPGLDAEWSTRAARDLARLKERR